MHLVDIINVRSIIGLANVEHWVEAENKVIYNAMYWRQVFNYCTLELSVFLTVSDRQGLG